MHKINRFYYNKEGRMASPILRPHDKKKSAYGMMSSEEKSRPSFGKVWHTGQIQPTTYFCK